MNDAKWRRSWCVDFEGERMGVGRYDACLSMLCFREAVLMIGVSVLCI